ncbi:MAG: LD-carboxypeptidase, partial [Proteobacteria bacterium]|nr:LD-carboxypeptidase [Pseudomonadota bacterium]
MKNKILVPEKLERGDTIGIAAPASPFDLRKFKRGIDVLESMGFNVYIPEGIFNRNGYLAGTDDQRASILNNLFSKKNIKAIVCARGGFGSLKILS